MKRLVLILVALISFTKAYPIYMVYVQGGTYEMGDAGSGSAKPLHEVVLGYDFYMGETEVIFNDFDYFCWKTDREFKDDNGYPREDNPAVNITWWDAIAFCNWLSEMYELPVAYDEETGELLDTNGNVTTDITKVAGYRLPTEAEWEFAANGGLNGLDTVYSGSDSVDAVSWYTNNSGGTTHEVATKQSNELGLYDMSGNVVEWCHDYYAPYTETTVTNPILAQGEKTERRVLRGGSFLGKAHYGKTFERGQAPPEEELYYIGFRITRTAIMLMEVEGETNTDALKDSSQSTTNKSGQASNNSVNPDRPTGGSDAKSTKPESSDDSSDKEDTPTAEAVESSTTNSNTREE